MRKRYSTLFKLKIFLDDKECDNQEQFIKKTTTLLRVLQQVDKLIFLAKYWISSSDKDVGKLTKPGAVLAIPTNMPERLCDLKAFFSGLRMRRESTISWTNIRVNSEADLPAKLEDIKGELRDHGIELFLQPIQDCRTKAIDFLPRIPSNSDLVY